MFRRVLQSLAVTASLLIMAGTAHAVREKSPNLIFEETTTWHTPSKPLDVVQSLDGRYVFILIEKKVLIYEPNGTLKGSVPVDKGVTAINTDPRGENIFLINSEKNSFSSISFDFVVDIDSAGSPFKGRADAPVTVTVFSDFE